MPDTYLLDRPVHAPGVVTFATHVTFPNDITDDRCRLFVDAALTGLDNGMTSRRMVLLAGPTVYLSDGAALHRNERVLLCEAIALDRYWPGRPWPTLDPFPRTTRLLAWARRHLGPILDSTAPRETDRG